MKKLIISTVVVGTVLFLLGWIVWVVLLGDFFKQYYSHLLRSESDMKTWAFVVANYGMALFIYLLYSKTYNGGSPVTEGVKFGFLLGLFWAFPYIFFTWGSYTVKYTGVVVDGIVGFIFIIIASVITALIHGKKEHTQQ